MKSYNSIKDIIGLQLAGGPFSIRLFSKLIGLDGPASLYKIRSLAWINDHIEISIETGKDGEIIFMLEKFRTGISGFLNTKYLCIRSRGDIAPASLRKIFAHKFSGKWKNATIEKLASLMLRDPKLGKPGLPLPPHVDTFRRVRSQLDTWGAGESYADFFARGELERSQLDSIDFFNHCINIQHSDIECSNVFMSGRGAYIQPIHFPWKSFFNDENMKGKTGERDKEDIEDLLMMSSTDLSENDVIMGSNKKVRDVLDFVLSKNPEKMIFFGNTCVPIVTGEDVESIVKDYQKKSPTPLIYLTCTSQSMNNVFKELLVNRRLLAEESITTSMRKGINLIGFQQDSYLDELIDMLGEIGVRINIILLPTLKFNEIDSLPRASLNVFLPNTLWRHLYDQLLLNSKIKYIFPEAPYGIYRTKKWIEEIVSSLDLNVNVEKAWKKGWTKIKKEWLELTSEAKNYRLGFVIRSEEIHYLLDPENTWGIPLIGATEEMGFDIDIIVKISDERAKDELISHLGNMFDNPSRHNILFYHDLDTMRQALLESKCDAVFSSHFFDWRITEAGKNKFSLQDFEMGIGGALTTIKRLLHLCKVPFYRKYSKYLRRTPMGLLV